MTYEAWRISYQSAEQAAKAAYNAWQQAMQCKGCDVPKDGVYQISEPSHSMSQYASKDDMLKAVMAENEQLKVQLAAAQGLDAQDAERYRWLKSGNDEKHSRATFIAQNMYGMEWDDAIDAELAAQAKQRGA